MRMSARSKRAEENEEESATLVALAVERATLLLTSAWSEAPTIARLTRFSQC